MVFELYIIPINNSDKIFWPIWKWKGKESALYFGSVFKGSERKDGMVVEKVYPCFRNTTSKHQWACNQADLGGDTVRQGDLTGL